MVNNNSMKFPNNYDISVIDWDEDKIQKFTALLIVGYFSVKIFYGIFGKYTQKPMKDEIVDFSVMIIMSALLYILTNMNQRTILGHLNNINWLFFMGYVLGLNIPFIYQQVMKDDAIMTNNALQYLFYAVFITIILIMVFLSVKSSSSNGNPLYYVMYLMMIAIIIAGIIITRKKPKIFATTKLDKNLQDILDQLTKYFNNDDLIPMIDSDDFRNNIQHFVQSNRSDMTDITNTMKNYNIFFTYNSLSLKDQNTVLNLLISLNKPIIQKGYLNSHGTYISFGLAMIGWLLSLLFMYDSDNNTVQNFISFFNGITIGLFVSGVSFYGFEYVLRDQVERQCFGDDDCQRKDMVMKDKEYEDLAAGLSTVKWGLSFTIIILISTIILFYLLRF